MTFRAITDDPQSYNNNAYYNDNAQERDTHFVFFLFAGLY